jgi:two-component system, chemotaxis family, response regulator PixH
MKALWYASMSGMSQGALHVLVVDDEPSVLVSVKLILRSLGWTATTTVNPKEGLDLARSLQPAAILCDATMPDWSGPELIRALKRDPATERIPIVLMSGNADADKLSGTGWTRFIAKPFSIRELRLAIESAVAN